MHVTEHTNPWDRLAFLREYVRCLKRQQSLADVRALIADYLGG